MTQSKPQTQPQPVAASGEAGLQSAAEILAGQMRAQGLTGVEIYSSLIVASPGRPTHRGDRSLSDELAHRAFLAATAPKA